MVAASTKELVVWIRRRLHDEFEMTDLGPLTSFLGLVLESNCNQRTVPLSQKRYIEKILIQHGLECCNPALTPADPHVRLEKSYPEFESYLKASKNTNRQ